MKFMRTHSIFAAVLLLAGCAGSPAWQSIQISATRSEAQRNNSNLMAVQIGSSREALLQAMGNPAKREAYQLANNKTIEFLFYRTGGWSNLSSTDTDAQFTPVAIENGVVAGWGMNYYTRVVRAAVDVTIK